MKILFFTLGDETVASSRTRVFQFLPHLKKIGVHAEVLQYRTGLDYKLLAKSPRGTLPRALLGMAVKAVSLFHCVYSPFQVFRLLRRARQVDIVFVQKVLLPPPIQDRLRQANPKIVFDYDDALYADEKAYSKALFDAQLRNSRLTVLENKNTEAYAQKLHVPYLRMTGPIDCSRYSPESAAQTPNEEIMIGWVGSRSTTQYLELLRRPLQEVSAKHPDVVLGLIGAGDVDLPGVRVKRFEWRLETEVDLLRLFHIGVMPLVDNEFTRGKGGYKILQYMAMGIPSVASPVGVNAEILLEGVTGFLCSQERQWINAFERLIAEKDLRVRMGEAARRRAQEVYSYEVNTPKLLKALERL